MAFEDLDFFGREDPADKNYWLITFPSLKTSTEYDFKFRWVFSDTTLNDKVGNNWSPVKRHLTKAIGSIKPVENLRADYKNLNETAPDTEGFFRVRFTHDNSLNNGTYDNTGISYYRITLQALSGDTSRTRTFIWAEFDSTNPNKVFSLNEKDHQDSFRDANGQGWVTQFRVTVIAVSKAGKESLPVTVDSATYVSPLVKPIYTIVGGPYSYTVSMSNFTDQAKLIGTIWIEEIVTNETVAPADTDTRWAFKQNFYGNAITIDTYPSLDYRWVRLVTINKISDPYATTPIKSPYGDPIRVKPTDPVGDSNDTTAPAIPSISTGTITYNSIQVTITTADIPETRGFRLRYKKSTETLYTTVIVAPAALSNSYTISGLEPDIIYNISVAAYDDGNNLSAYSADINATTSTVTVSPVTNVQLKAGTYSVIGTWTAPVSPPTRIDQYKVELYNSLNSLQQTLYTYSTTVTFVGLSAGTTYYIKVHSVDIYGKESAATPSNNITLNSSGSASDGSPPSSNPTPIVNPLYKALEIKWTAVPNADPVTYDVHISKTNNFTPTYSTTATNTLALKTSGTFAVIKTMPDPISPNTILESPPTIYYVKIIARDYDGPSTAAVTQASSTTSLVDNGDIAANAISANQIQVNTINSEKVLSSELLVDKVFTIGGKRAAISSATVSGGNIVYTTSGAHGFLVNSLVTVTALSPSTFNISETQITAVTTTAPHTFTIANTTGATGSSTGTGTAIAIGKSAIKIDSGSDPYRLYSGSGSYGTTGTPFYLDTNGRFSLKDRLFFDGNTTLTVKGVIEAASGNFTGNMTVSGGTMKFGASVNPLNHPTTGTLAGTYHGLYIDANNYWFNNGWFSVGGASNTVTWNGTKLAVTGEITASSGTVTGNFGVTSGTLYVGTTNTNVNDRILINSGGIAGYPATSNIANFILTLDGTLTAKKGNIGGWIISETKDGNGAVVESNIYKGSIFLDSIINAIYAGNKATLSAGLITSSASGDIAIWAGSGYSNRASAPFNVTLGGAVTMTSATITGGGLIKSSNYVFSAGPPQNTTTADGSAFSVAGTAINLSTGTITSPKFRINSSGAAFFSGSLDVGVIISSPEISGGTVSGTAITGGSFTTTNTESGVTYAKMKLSGETSDLQFLDLAGTTVKGRMYSFNDGNEIIIMAGARTTVGYPSDTGYISINPTTLAFGFTNTLAAQVQGLSVSKSGGSTFRGGSVLNYTGSSVGTASFRNIAAGTGPKLSTDTDGLLGDIWIQYAP